MNHLGRRRRLLKVAPEAPEIWGAFGASNDFKNVTRSMRIPNMCLVLKSDKGKVFSMENEQNHRQTESQTIMPTSSTNIDIYHAKIDICIYYCIDIYI